ncbi:glutamate ABC transporter substrate-binding protein [Nocardiopsis sp. EMB25]|uniref:glutamate ABC transporter substrate-binding protein n=1 Tax=Nocardiopsis TaxID=2013 RepID=UPI000348134E|nr:MULTISPECIES: glutamate ABC transporter substrate-binding protein [Nocardiopsis]MCY9787214.1 glutamate ABC transporter substrate-binding protein [Nocardiopsis sp. EMB25]
MRLRHRPAAAAAALVLGLSACSEALGEEVSVLDAESITVGVKYDQPGTGLRGPDGELTGFDVDVAYYLTERLGFPADRVELVGVTSAEREDLLIGGEVDMVVATYSITQARKADVTFGGPYYVAQQDLLVRAEDTDIDDVRDLEGLRVCQGKGSNSARRITQGLGIRVEQTDAPSYGACADALREGEVDAMSTDNLILAGFLAQAPDTFRLVNNPFTEEKYGVGLPHGDVRACEAVNKAITEMYQDGTAGQLLETWFGETGLDLVTSVPQFEGCP